jgi:cobalt-zinc-cadmium efflux system membrane fusion protein
MKYSIVFFLFILTASCDSKKEAPAQEQVAADAGIATLTPAQLSNSNLAYGKPELLPIATVLKLNGKIDVPPDNLVSVSAPMGGYLKTTAMLPGMHIRKGDVLAVLEDQQYIQLQQDYLMTKSKLEYSQLEYDRQKELNQSKASSDKVLQQAASELSTQKITLSALSEKLRLINIDPSSVTPGNITRSIRLRAPINGYVSKVYVNIGKYISPTDVLFELVNPDDIHLALKVFEKDLDKLFIGQKLVAYTNNQPDKRYPCEIILIGKDLNASRNTEVHCHFEAYDKTLIPGTYMNADVQVKVASRYVLPEDAIVRYERKEYAFIQLSDSQFQMTEVRTGITDNKYIELPDGDTLANKTFVVKGAYTLLMTLKNRSEE